MGQTLRAVGRRVLAIAGKTYGWPRRGCGKRERSTPFTAGMSGHARWDGSRNRELGTASRHHAQRDAMVGRDVPLHGAADRIGRGPVIARKVVGEIRGIADEHVVRVA